MLRDLSKLADRELVGLQGDSNEWRVRQARRLLQERAEAGSDMKQVHRQLLAMFEQEAKATIQLRAMWALYTTGGSSESWLRGQLEHDSEHVRVWAIQLLVDQGTISQATRDAFVDLSDRESSGLVLTFLASSLQRHSHADRWKLAQNLVGKSKFAADPVYPLIVWYGVEPAVTEHQASAILLAGLSKLPIVRRHIVRRLTGEMQRQPKAVEQIVRLLADHKDVAVQRDILGGMETALKGWRKAEPPAGWSQLQPRLASSKDEEVRRLARELALVFGDGRALDALRKIANSARDLDARRGAIRTLVATRDKNIVPVLQSLVGDRELAVDAIRGTGGV